MVSNPAFENYKLRAFIPSFRVLRTGIIKGVDQSLPLDCIKENIRTNVKIIDIQRLNRRTIINNQPTYTPSRTLCIKFAGQSLPKEIVLFNALYPVEPYIPKVRICYVCYRVGHIGKDCKNTKPRCLYCGLEHGSTVVCANKDLPHTCINCEGEHLATSFDCPVIRKYKEVLNLAAYENIPQVEARKIINANNGYSTKRDLRNFPYISSRSTQQDRDHFRDKFSNRFYNLRDEDPGEHDSPQKRSYADILSSQARSTRPTNKPRIISMETLPTECTSHARDSNKPAYNSNKYASTLQKHKELLLSANGHSYINNQHPLRTNDDVSGSPQEEYSRQNWHHESNGIVDQILDFLINLRSLLNIQQFTSFIDLIIEFLQRLATMFNSSNFNLGSIFSLFSGLKASNLFDSTGTSASYSPLHQQ
ncbi:hypothetical protein ALC57_02215 [Trachymyrmex cornetzi]|uniref:CCHC-type domain-containing protein n=1 Tax=Trachymyrmex cornetzi TaxID=471704 RepID=A0A151JP14_9HYME|nr:hypothetical protein ALC57_02926 [Trachymyrmex cornetzi]KYN28376.1 hypothetical protein ALC57_02215 [Trachymyrmex cornetzi]